MKFERDIIGSDRDHLSVKEYKSVNRKLEQNLNTRNERLDKVINEFDGKMKESKNILFN